MTLDAYRRMVLTGGDLAVELDSGRRVSVRATAPVEGVLRLRIGDPSVCDDILLPDLDDRPVDISAQGTGVALRAPGVSAVWRDGQDFRLGPFARFAEPAASTVPYAAGAREATDDRPAGWVETVHLPPGARVYGGGESYQGPNLRGRHRYLRNTEQDRNAGRDSAYLNVPLLWSDAGWGLFVHTGGVVDADLGAEHVEAARIEVDGPGIDLFLLLGDGPTILRRYSELTGRPGPLPDWAFGVWMSRSSYFTAAEMVAVADDLRAADCPVDVMHVDEWLAESVLDDAAWSSAPNRTRFPSGWTSELASRGVRTSVWINPYLAKGSALADEATAKGYLIRTPDGEPAGAADNPDTLPVDFTDPEAREWWQGRLAEVLGAEGVSALLSDFGEEVPPDAVFDDGRRGRDRHNSYGLIYAETVWEVGRRVRPDDFAPIFRAGTAGSQRTPAHWAGDMPSTWAGLVSSLRACLSMSLSGFAVVSHDSGGYWTPSSYDRALELRKTMTPDAVEADVEPELYARWAQWGALSPIMRFHGVGRREPTAYPEPARSVAVAACRLRKALQPYLVSVAASASADGSPMMRPMVLAYPGDRAGRDAELQYLLGPDLLVAPLLEPGGTREVWFPPGEWVPVWGASAGSGWATIRCEIDQFPVYARAGSAVAGVVA
ncbi:glycoside hydrolase family 31 protein [Cryptosporangium phraense]|uniref:Glycoside hydrolase family 31 protein n=1 Tax=Cryptosporangium phraense TaxID=2593070 RepID=A0A545AY71_9ACTN|nr:TIM-barrel domain-containing protein [Cryptosporangium phraense]TQS46286.1 glycoside hydrolase family 31 protein [Cryptosporangium phraense]